MWNTCRHVYSIYMYLVNKLDRLLERDLFQILRVSLKKVHDEIT